MGGTYWIVPEESRTELYSVKLAYVQLVLWVLMGVTAVIGYFFRWGAGTKLLEQPLPHKIVIVVVMLMFLWNVAMTIRRSGRFTTTEGVLLGGLGLAALLYLPALDEDDTQPGLWMVHTTDPMEHAEDPFGLNRPNDHEGDAEDAAGAADSLSELEQARLVSTPGRARETFVCTDAPSPRSANPGVPSPEDAAGMIFPEWDFTRDAYLDGAVRVRVGAGTEGAADWAERALGQHAGLLTDIRRRLGALRGTRQWLRRQPEGDDIDIDAVVATRPERRAGLPPSSGCYLHRRPKPKRLALLLLLDGSGSTDAWIADGARDQDLCGAAGRGRAAPACRGRAGPLHPARRSGPSCDHRSGARAG